MVEMPAVPVTSAMVMRLFKHIPLGVLAHSTHVRGDGRYENGIEYPRASVKLATRLSPQDCE